MSEEMNYKAVKYIVTLFCGCSIFNCNSQQIDSVKIIPLNPTSVDSIYVVTSVTMATTANGYLGYELYSVGTTITIEACYKHGMLDAPQTYIDTINLGVKAIGAYTLNFFAYASYSIPCDHSDTSDFQTNFIVTTQLAIDETESEEFAFRLFPNPVQNIINLSNTGGKVNQLTIYSVDGREVFNQKIENQNSVDVSDLPAGVYVVKVISDDGFFTVKILKK